MYASDGRFTYMHAQLALHNMPTSCPIRLHLIVVVAVYSRMLEIGALSRESVCSEVRAYAALALLHVMHDLRSQSMLGTFPLQDILEPVSDGFPTTHLANVRSNVSVIGHGVLVEHILEEVEFLIIECHAVMGDCRLAYEELVFPVRLRVLRVTCHIVSSSVAAICGFRCSSLDDISIQC